MIPEPSRDSASTAPLARLNIFALPTRTTLLFGLIVLVIALPLLASFGSGSPICAPFIVFWMLLLPLRDFLRRPELTQRELALTDARAQFAFLSTAWKRLSAQIGIKPPRLMITRRNISPFAFGTLTRRFTAFSETAATTIEQSLQSPNAQSQNRSEAILLHELAHFCNRDVWMALFSRGLLKITVLFMALSFFVTSLTPWLYTSIITLLDFSKTLPPELIELMTASDPRMQEAILHPPVISAVAWERYEAFVLGAHAPLVVGSLILFLFYWRALLRTRELYADARVALWQRDDGRALLEQLLLGQVEAVQSKRGNDWREKLTTWFVRAQRVDIRGFGKMRAWLDPHPTRKVRRACLREPERIYGSDAAIALTAGGAVVLLNLMLGSLFLSRYIRGPNSGVPFLVGFVVIALSLLPFLCQFPERAREYSTKVKRIVLMFTAIKLIPQYTVGLFLILGLLIDPTAMDWAAYALVPGVGDNPPPTGIPLEFIFEMFVIRPALYFTFVMPVVLIVFLHVDAWIKRRILRWFSASVLARYPIASLWGVTILLALALGLILLPIFDALTIPTAHDLLDPLTCLGMLFALAIGIGGLIVFWNGERHYRDRCPRCGARFEGAYRLGSACRACDFVFHPQFIAPSFPMIS